MQRPVFFIALFHIPAFADILAAGADGEPAAVAADVGEDLWRGFGVDLANEVLVDVILFLETEVFHRLCIVALDLFLRVAEVSPQLVGAAGAEAGCDESRREERAEQGAAWVRFHEFNIRGFLIGGCRVRKSPGSSPL